MKKIISILSLIVLLAVLPTGSQELNGPGAFNTLESPSTQEGEEYHPPKEVERKKNRYKKHLNGQVTPSVDNGKFAHRPIDGDHKKPIQHPVGGDHGKPIQHPVGGDHKKPIQHPVNGDHRKPFLNPITRDPLQHFKNDKSKHRPRRKKRRKRKGRFKHEIDTYRKLLARVIKYGAPIYYPSVLKATNVTPGALRTSRRTNDREFDREFEKFAKVAFAKYYYTTLSTHRNINKKTTTPARPTETTSIYGPTFRPLGPEYTNSYYATFTFPTTKKKKTVSPTTNFIQAYLATAFGRRPKTTTPQPTKKNRHRKKRRTTTTQTTTRSRRTKRTKRRKNQTPMVTPDSDERWAHFMSKSEERDKMNNYFWAS